jgi:fluoride exporter
MEFASTVPFGTDDSCVPQGAQEFFVVCAEGNRARNGAGNGEDVRILFLILFGALGTLARYGLDGWIQYRVGSVFPAGTLTINLLGCLFLGAIGQFSLNHITVSPDLRIGLTVGLMGGFTTFSTFGWDTARMLEEGEWTKASLYVGVSVLGGLIAMMLGMRAGDVL